MNLKEKPTRGKQGGAVKRRGGGGSLGKFSAVLFLSARLQKAAAERESGVGRARELWKGRGTTRGRGGIYLASGRRKNRQKVRPGETRRLNYCRRVREVRRFVYKETGLRSKQIKGGKVDTEDKEKRKIRKGGGRGGERLV